MSAPVLIGFAGVLVAAAATGMLAGRCVRQPRIAFIVWTAATLALTVALAAESLGFERGFGPATFRAVQLFALLLAPLWLAWGLAEQVWPSEAARFGARLVCGALTVIGAVILATDPLTATAFGKSWPLADQHYQPPSHYALDAAQTVAILITVAASILAAMQASNNPRVRSAMVRARVAAVHRIVSSLGWRTVRPASRPVATAATSTPANPISAGSDISPAGAHGPAALRSWPGSGYFLLRRWIRVFFSSLRCFFLAMRLRRFLMTEPIGPPFSALRMTGTPTRSPGQGGWTHTQGKRLPLMRRAGAADPGPPVNRPHRSPTRDPVTRGSGSGAPPRPGTRGPAPAWVHAVPTKAALRY